MEEEEGWALKAIGVLLEQYAMTKEDIYLELAELISTRNDNWVYVDND